MDLFDYCNYESFPDSRPPKILGFRGLHASVNSINTFNVHKIYSILVQIKYDLLNN